MQDYKTLHALVMICAVIIKTHRHTHMYIQTHKQFMTHDILLAQPAELKTTNSQTLPTDVCNT